MQEASSTSGWPGVLRPLDHERLRAEFARATPFPFVVLENFLEPDFAREVARSYPSFEEAERIGTGFKAVNENRKVQVTDYSAFPSPVKTLADALASPDFMGALSAITGVERLLWDDTYTGGGMHQTASTGLLDVHVDFNLLEGKNWYRRLNLLLYLNPIWDDAWGGRVELWDRTVTRCHHSFVPVMNRCVIFETSEHSFHGVTPVQCPENVRRQSFAAYYYTREAPAGWEGRRHSTIFKARPTEHLKKHVLMPAEQLRRRLKTGVRLAKDSVKRVIGKR